MADAGTAVVATDYPGLGTPGTHPFDRRQRGHFQVRAGRRPAVADWLLDRMQGDPLPACCTRTTA